MKKYTSLLIIIIIALGSTVSLMFFIRSKQSSLSIITIEGKDHYELGKDYGEKAKDQIQGVCTLIKELEDATGFFDMTFDDIEDAYKPYIPDYLIDEMKGVAKGAGVRYIDIFVLNAFAEVMMLISYGDIENIACTQFAKLNKVDKDTGPILGRTLDFFPSFLLQDFQVFLVANINGTKWIGHTIAGMVGFLTGMNDDGLVVSVSLVNTADSGDGIPMVLAIRHALQTCENVTQAEELISNQTHSLGWNYFLIDKHANAAIVEVTHTHNNTRWLGGKDEDDDYLAAANDFHSDAMEEYCHPSENSKWRKQRAEELMEEEDDFNVGDAIEITRDTYDGINGMTNPGLNTICRKWLRKTFLPGGTLGSFIGVPKEEYVVVSNGYPDSALWYAVNFKGEVVGPIA